jgi:hypothetical protein
MKNAGILIAIVCSVVLLMGCAGVQAPLLGFVYTGMEWDGDAEGPVGTKQGQACANSILGIAATGDASIAAAARNGGISNVTTVDRRAKSVLMFWAQYCTIVRGS